MVLSGRGWRALAPALLAVGLMTVGLPAGGAAAQNVSCDAVGPECGSALKFQCLARLGAGAEKLGDEEKATCASQFETYRACLTQAAQSCAGAEKPAEVRAFKASLTTDLCAVGVWKGPIVEPGSIPYNIFLEVGMRNGVPFARMNYPELSCRARGEHLEGPTEGRILFREVVETNRTKCADGRFAITCLADGRLHWRWFRDNGEQFDAVLTR